MDSVQSCSSVCLPRVANPVCNVIFNSLHPTWTNDQTEGMNARLAVPSSYTQLRGKVAARVAQRTQMEIERRDVFSRGNSCSVIKRKDQREIAKL